jgi:hypothetical protein
LIVLRKDLYSRRLRVEAGRGLPPDATFGGSSFQKWQANSRAMQEIKILFDVRQLSPDEHHFRVRQRQRCLSVGVKVSEQRSPGK